MKILYIFPHPDDESFGPVTAMHKQLRQGHEVYLLTLTRGGATKQRFRLKYSVAEMGEIRLREMKDVEKTVGLTGMTVLNLPDSGLKEMDPREIEEICAVHIRRIRPDVVVTYPVHGISGFHDHLVCHSSVKRTCLSLKEAETLPKRLAFYTITGEQAAASNHFPLSGSTEEEIDCRVRVSRKDLEACRAALDCYVTFQETIRKSGIRDLLSDTACFEIFGEQRDPCLEDLTSDI